MQVSADISLAVRSKRTLSAATTAVTPEPDLSCARVYVVINNEAQNDADRSDTFSASSMIAGSSMFPRSMGQYACTTIACARQYSTIGFC